MDRRTLLKGMVGLGAAALILPPTLAENVEVARRYWALDQTMVRHPVLGEWHFVVRGPDLLGFYGWQATAYRDRPDLPPGLWEGRTFVRREQHTTPIIWEAAMYAPGYVPAKEVALNHLADLIAQSAI